MEIGQTGELRKGIAELKLLKMSLSCVMSWAAIYICVAYRILANGFTPTSLWCKGETRKSIAGSYSVFLEAWVSFILGSNRPRTSSELNYITPALRNNLFSGGGNLGNQAASPEVNFGSPNGASLRNCHRSTSELGENFHKNNQMLSAAEVCNTACFTGWDGWAGRTWAEQRFGFSFPLFTVPILNREWREKQNKTGGEWQWYLKGNNEPDRKIALAILDLLLRKFNCVSGQLCFSALLWSIMQARVNTCASQNSGRTLLFTVRYGRKRPSWSFPSKDSTSRLSKRWSPVFTGIWCIFSTCNKLLLFSLQLLETLPVPGLFIRIVIFLLLKRGKYLFFLLFISMYHSVRDCAAAGNPVVSSTG